MSRPSETLLEQLSMVAEDLREVIAERGHRIDVALDTDYAFGSGQSRSWLMRDLAIDGLTQGASRAGLDFHPVNGDGREIRTLADSVDRRFRCRKASRTSDGEIVVMASSDAPLAVDEEDALYSVEAWIFGWIPTSSTNIEEVFVAPILAFEVGNPGHFVLGEAIPLLAAGTTPPGGRGFVPTDEALPGFEDGDAAGDADIA